jgi:hypothetical protein
LNVVITVVLAIALAAVLITRRSAQRRATTVTHGVYAAWYARTPTPVLVVEQTTYEGEYRDPDGDLRRSRDAKTTIRYHSHRLEGGAHLGSFSREGWRVPIAGVWNDRVWVCGKGEPELLAADGLKLVADRTAIRKAIADGVGGDFEIGGGKCYVDEHSGRLAVKGADGKRHWVTTDLRVEPHTRDAVHPPGYDCSLPSGLIEPRLAECMAPDAGPANVLVLSKSSALAKDAGQPELLSGVSASYDKGARVLWTKPLTELTGHPDPFWLGAQPLGPGRVAVLIRTTKMRVHVIELDPADGTIKASKVLFDTASPGR